MGNIVAQLKGVSKQYQSGDTLFTALQPTDLELYEGELLLLMGPSGSGKTTLLSLIGTVIYPTTGEVMIGGMVTGGMSETELSRLRLNNIGFVFQSYNLISPLKAVENVGFPLLLQGVDRNVIKSKALDALKSVGLEARANALPKQMSGGEQQRTGIARALVTDPGLILCDEPTGALDQKSGEMVMNQLKLLAGGGKCVVVVTHDSRLMSYADRILYVGNGYVSQDPIM